MPSKSFTLNLTKTELKALQDLIYENPCNAGCIWDECEEKANKIKNEERRYNYCYEGCTFHKAQESLQKKVEVIVESMNSHDK